ncbi:carbon storage regulator CsrA [Prochlorococcus marinus str. MU1402]|uniref:carbon storage regulator CsrA n=1 Tax=Prochlorococcus marinus TaxID=1219 RepID=UPI001ADD4FF9|nr:carbon storage regulator CsrA [Prochlorococcus marinus]MBO8232564.1 carbon storage regulator CsrA [Prochlorococcus marinus XMU1402]MBW3057283.1 carbon storage regulator CsrA [Prochlorococcus marinus str. MU1402]
MFKNLILSFFLFIISFITIYPSNKENTNLIAYCYSLEKLLSRNSLEKSKSVSKKYKTFAKDIILFSTNKTKGSLVNKIIDQYKNSKNSLIISIVPNKIYCLAGYWIEEVNPGTFQAIFYEKSKQKINQYKKIRKEVDEFIKDINSEYKSIEKEINNFF